MTGFRFAIVGFDLDGTLLDTSGDLAAAVNHALAADGRAPLSVAAVKRIVGGGTRTMLARALDETGGGDMATVERLLPVLLDHYAAHMTDATRPFAGALDALDALAERGVRLAVVTNKLERFARALLDHFALTTRFDLIVGGDSAGVGAPKPAPDMIRHMVSTLGGGPAAFVGDSAYDVQAARAADVPVVACTFGFCGQAARDLGADATIERYADLVTTLDLLRYGGDRA